MEFRNWKYNLKKYINFIELKVNLKYTAASQVYTRFSTFPKLMKPSLLQWVLRDQKFCHPINDKL